MATSSAAFLTKSMKLLAAKITTLSEQIDSLQVDEEQPFNKELENAVSIDLGNLQKLMKEVQTKAQDKKLLY
ncbi:MAG: hypothetical protein K1060chlam4_01320 [Candidatus Anoxychlamydiales bacterium]|nr:hypothetical protein [Candidatus Anoxychlamydiales bacterium]